MPHKATFLWSCQLGAQFSRTEKKSCVHNCVSYFKVIKYALSFLTTYKIAFLTPQNRYFFSLYILFLYTVHKIRGHTTKFQKFGVLRTSYFEQRPRKHEKYWNLPIFRGANSHVAYLRNSKNINFQIIVDIYFNISKPHELHSVPSYETNASKLPFFSTILQLQGFRIRKV